MEYFHDHVRIERMLFDGVVEPVGGALRPDRSRPGPRPDVQARRRSRFALYVATPRILSCSSISSRAPSRTPRSDACRATPPGVRPDQRGAWNGDAAALAAALRARITGEVRFDDGSRALYATDASNYRQVPIGVVVPRDADDVVAAVAIARRYGAPILARGGGTSLAGECCNVAVVLDCSKYFNRVLEIDAERRWRASSRGSCSTTCAPPPSRTA